MNSLLDERSDSMDTIEMTQTSISGYLYKKSSSGNWQRRYFETNGSHLTYYKSHKMTKLLAALSLPQVGSIRMVYDSVSESQSLGAIFQIDLKDRQLQLRAPTHDEAKRWIQVLIALRDGSLRDSGTFLPDALAAARNDDVSSRSGSGSGSTKSVQSSIDRQASATIWKTNRILSGSLCAPCCSYLAISS